MFHLHCMLTCNYFEKAVYWRRLLPQPREMDILISSSFYAWQKVVNEVCYKPMTIFLGCVSRISVNVNYILDL